MLRSGHLKLAIERLKEALGEIKTVARYDPETAAEGAILLMERLWSTLQGVDSCSGTRGTATSKTVHALIDILLVAPVEGAILERQLERLWTAVEEDGVDFLSEVAARWGELCRTPERASRAADDFLPALRLSWRPEHRGCFKGTTACLSCLLEAGRHQELLDLIETAPFLWWHDRRYGVRALAAQGRTDAAIHGRWSCRPLAFAFYLRYQTLHGRCIRVGGRALVFQTKFAQAVRMIAAVAKVFAEAPILVVADSWFGNAGLITPRPSRTPPASGDDTPCPISCTTCLR